MRMEATALYRHIIIYLVYATSGTVPITLLTRDRWIKCPLKLFFQTEIFIRLFPVPSPAKEGTMTSTRVANKHGKEERVGRETAS